ncbi:glycosyltransferase involved in cell wall biosynthesis [Desulfohalotomaculum tongense]|uniref:glycosyltransferase family 4 protein n=1 Tax=Desulforadius tongensis TaxID=1216062 RepID=UPI001957489F|nr:glycosyltransferase family 4 protein [Desulforadius tongensis]MBM7855889.1 glycosyltransferase involved in cell wall biosynthesis [Desulforadius tongensis]
MAKIKVLHLIRPAAGGMKKHLLDLVRLSDRSLYQVEAAVPHDCVFKQELRETGVNILSIPLKGDISPLWDWQAVWQLARYLKEQKVTILHSHGSKAALVGRMAALIANTPVVLFTVHNSIFYEEWPQWKKKLMAAAENILAKRTDKIITVSNQLRDQIIRLEKIPEEKIVTIYNGIDVSKIKCRVNKFKLFKTLGLPPLGRLVGVAARLAPQKGVEYFLKAASLLKEYQANFVVIGEGPLRRELMAEAKNLGLKNRVFFVGYRNDIERVLPGIDIFVLPSVTEGLPLTILEAMAAGRPVVASRVGGIPEVIENRQTGLLVEPKNPAELAKAIAGLLEDRQWAEEMGAAGRKLVKEKFTVEKMVGRTMNLYRQLLQEKEIISGHYNQPREGLVGSGKGLKRKRRE